MSQKIKDSTKAVKEFISGLLKPDMSKEEIDSYNKIISRLDSIDEEDTARDSELIECKEVIINQVKNQGSNEKPHGNDEPRKPRSLEEIATEEIGGK